MRNDRIFTATAILLLAIWAGYNLYMSYTSPSYCPMGNHSIYSYSNILPILLIVILALSLLPRQSSPKPPGQTRGVKRSNSGLIRPNSTSTNGGPEGWRDEGQYEGQNSGRIRNAGKTEEGHEHVNKGQNDESKRVHHIVPGLLSIIRESPGITQEELRDITGYSASKISVEVKKLEEKGLIRREKYGRTYRIYPE